MPPLIVEAFLCVIPSLITVLWFFSATERNVKFQPKTSPKNANFCNKTNLIFLNKKTTKKAS